MTLSQTSRLRHRSLCFVIMISTKMMWSSLLMIMLSLFICATPIDVASSSLSATTPSIDTGVFITEFEVDAEGTYQTNCGRWPNG
jgi:hypothetical protein